MNTPSPFSLPAGFRAIVTNIGIKDSTDDLVVVAAEHPVAAAGVFTQSRFVGPSVTVSRAHIADQRATAMVVISKNANVANGEQGMSDAHEVVQHVASLIGCEETDVLIASTGVIGRPYPMDRVRAGFAAIADDEWTAHLDDVARGIMTTDTVEKTSIAPIHGTGAVVAGEIGRAHV